jgi:hypothetical protein
VVFCCAALLCTEWDISGVCRWRETGVMHRVRVDVVCVLRVL